MANLQKLTNNEIITIKKQVGNIENFKNEYKVGPPSQLDLYKAIDTPNKEIYVCLKGGKSPEPTGVYLDG